MQWTILLTSILFVVVLGDIPRKQVDWNKIMARDAIPVKFNSNQPRQTRHPLLASRSLTGGKIIGGDVATRGKFPHQAGLIIDLFSFCGGSLISNLYVLTAAHCTYGAYQIDVYLGAHNIRENEEEARQEIRVTYENFITHQNYDPYTIANDISLIMLSARIQFTDFIQPIRLPTRTEAKQDLEDLSVLASGWGRDSDTASSISPVLRYAHLRVQPKVICKHFFSDIILNTNLCTDTGRGQGTCGGDSGGPLIYENPSSTPYVVGLTSFGSSIACVGAGWPSVFTYIPGYLNWIRDNTDIVIID